MNRSGRPNEDLREGFNGFERHCPLKANGSYDARYTGLTLRMHLSQ